MGCAASQTVATRGTAHDTKGGGYDSNIDSSSTATLRGGGGPGGDGSLVDFATAGQNPSSSSAAASAAPGSGSGASTAARTRTQSFTRYPQGGYNSGNSVATAMLFPPGLVPHSSTSSSQLTATSTMKPTSARGGTSGHNEREMQMGGSGLSSGEASGGVLFSVLPSANTNTYAFRQTLGTILSRSVESLPALNTAMGLNNSSSCGGGDSGESNGEPPQRRASPGNSGGGALVDGRTSPFSLSSAESEDQLLYQCVHNTPGRFVHPYTEVDKSLQEGRDRKMAASQGGISSNKSSGGMSGRDDELHYGPNGLLSGVAAANPGESASSASGGGQLSTEAHNPLQPSRSSPGSDAINTIGTLHIESLSTLCPRTLDEANLWNRNLKGGSRHPVFGVKMQTPKERQKLRTKEITRSKVTGRAILLNHPGAGNEPLPFPCFERSTPGELFADIALRTAHSMYHYVELQQWRNAAEEAKAGYTLAGIQLTNFYALFRHAHVKLCDLMLVESNPNKFLQLLRGSGLMTVYVPSSLDPNGHPVPSSSGSQSSGGGSATSINTADGFMSSSGTTTGQVVQVGSSQQNQTPLATNGSREAALNAILGGTVVAADGGVVGMPSIARIATSTDYSAVNSYDLARLATIDIVEEVIYTIKTIEALLLQHKQSVVDGGGV